MLSEAENSRVILRWQRQSSNVTALAISELGISGGGNGRLRSTKSRQLIGFEGAGAVYYFFLPLVSAWSQPEFVFAGRSHRSPWKPG